MNEREAFEQAIKENKYDQTARLVFADWLEEHGLDSEAEEQRRWTPEWQQGEDYLVEFCRQVAEDDGLEKPPPLSELVMVVNNYLDTGQGSNFGDFMGFGASNMWLNVKDEFWKHWQAYSRKEVSSEDKDGEPFTCCW